MSRKLGATETSKNFDCEGITKKAKCDIPQLVFMQQILKPAQMHHQLLIIIKHMFLSINDALVVMKLNIIFFLVHALGSYFNYLQVTTEYLLYIYILVFLSKKNVSSPLYALL